MQTTRQAYLARVHTPADGGDAASPTSHVVIQHHRAPQVEWSVDRATGGHLLHLALAQCVFNNVLRLAKERGLPMREVVVEADGDFNAEGDASTGIDCSIELESDADQSELVALAEAAFAGSTVVAVLRRAGQVELRAIRAGGSEAAHPAG